MRPVNLIPPEDRRGDSAPSRTGALSWIVVGGLALLVLLVGGVVVTNKDVADKQAELAVLEGTEAELSARAESLAAFTSFQQIRDARVETVAALAESRFDWQRVMEELSRVIPAHVWLVKLLGNAGTTDDSGAATATTGTPSLEMTGCARSQRAVARMISAIGDIDGVTRVSATRSEKADASAGVAAAGGSSSGGGSSDEDCRTRSYVAQFDLIAVFDGVAVPEGAVPPAVAPTPGESGDAAPPAPADDDGGVPAAQQTRAENAAGVAEADRRAKKGVGIAAGGNG